MFVESQQTGTVNIFITKAQKYVPIELLTVTISVSRRIVPFPSESCLSKLERVKANSIEVVKIIDSYHIPTM